MYMDLQLWDTSFWFSIKYPPGLAIAKPVSGFSAPILSAILTNSACIKMKAILALFLAFHLLALSSKQCTVSARSLSADSAEVSSEGISWAYFDPQGKEKEWQEKKLQYKNSVEEELKILERRGLIDHIDYAGATTHPPIEPPRKRRPVHNKRSLKSPSEAPH